MIQELTYKDANGKLVKAAYADKGNVYQLSAKREQFAVLAAQGVEPIDAYCHVYGVELSPDTERQCKQATQGLLHDTAVVLRIQELKQPVLRKIRRKIEYSLQQALQQCETAYDLAFAQGDVKGLLAATRMQAELSKLLSQELNVNHRYGVLDDTDTQTLLALQREVQVRLARQNKKVLTVASSSETVAEEGQGAAVVPSVGPRPEAVPN